MNLSLENDKDKDQKDEVAVQLPAKKVVYAEGERADFLYIIRRGKVRVVKESENRLISIIVLGDREFVGEIGVFEENGMRINSAITLEPTEMTKIHKKDLKVQLNKYPDWIKKIVLTLSSRLDSAENIIREHKIIADHIHEEEYFSSEEEVQLKELLREYRKVYSVPKK